MRFVRHSTRPKNEAGFTLVEVVIAVALGAIVFTALAAYLNGGLRMLAVQKARTQGNEIATQGIEDLQRLDDDFVGLCAAPSSPPAGFTDPVLLPNCASATFTHPCVTTATPTPPADLAPSGEYSCSRLNIDYTVKRYVAWTDAAKTSKKIGAYVTWTDSGTPHEVFQQSSRSNPSATPTVTPANVSGVTSAIDSSGTLAAGLVLDATTTGLANPAGGDAVRVSFTYRDSTGIPRPAVVTLGSTGTNTWSGVIAPADFKFPRGTQFFIFTASRAEDRSSANSSAIPYTFNCACPASPAPTASGTSVTVTPPLTATVDIDSAGTLISDPLVITASTTQVNPGSVFVVLPTTTGAQSLPMTLNSCAGPTCTWKATISRAVAGTRGLRFVGSVTPQDVRFLATQGVSSGLTGVSPAGSFTVTFR